MPKATAEKSIESVASGAYVPLCRAAGLIGFFGGSRPPLGWSG